MLTGYNGPLLTLRIKRKDKTMDYFDYYDKDTVTINKTNLAIQASTVVIALIFTFKILSYGINSVLLDSYNANMAVLLILAFIDTVTISLVMNETEGGIAFAIATSLMTTVVFIMTQIIRFGVVHHLIQYDILIALVCTILLIIGLPMSLFIALTITDYIDFPITQIHFESMKR